MTNTLFTSDLHFSHKNICKFTNRGLVTTADDHTSWLINLWNSQVAPGDTVYHLGDFCFSHKYEDWVEIVGQLNGSIHLILGNHDNPQVVYKADQAKLFAWIGPYKEITIANTKTCLFHYPIHSWNKQAYGSYHLHGHCHSNLLAPKGKMLDVGLDNAYVLFGTHKFFTIDDITTILDNTPLHIADTHEPS